MGDDAERAFPTLARVSLTDRDSGVRAAAVNALTDAGASERQLLANAVGLLDHPDQTVRARAAWAIGKLDPDIAVEATSDLSLLIATDPALDARFGATWALGRMRVSTREAIEALRRGLQDSEGDVRAEAARAVGRTGEAAVASVVQGLVALLSDSDPFAREQAAIALRRLDAGRADAIGGLRTLLADPTGFVREAARETLESWSESAGSDGAPVKVGGSADDGTGARRDAAAPDPGLEERLLDPDDFARAETPWKLAKIGSIVGDDTTARLILQAFVDRDSDARWSALFAIARIANRSPELTRSVLWILSHDRDPDVREAAAAALGELWRESPTDAVSGLAAALSDKDALVREDAAEALGRIGPAAVDATDALRMAFRDPHSGVRARVAEALTEVTGRG